MKIAILLPRFDSGGVERNVLRLTSGFIAEGHEVDLLTTSKVDGLLRDLPDEARIIDISSRFPVRRIPGILSPRAVLGILSIFKISKYLKSELPDSLLVAQSNFAAVAAKFLSRTPTRIVMRIAISQSSSINDDRYRMARFVPLIRRYVLRKAEKIVCNSEYVSREIVEMSHVPKERVITIPNPSADPQIIVRGGDPVAHRWIRDKTIPLAVAVGRLAKQKDYRTLLIAHSIVLKSRECNLLILGSGIELDSLIALVDQLGTGSHVEFAGFTENPWAYMAKADVFVISSAWEGSPNSLIEAVSMGIPAISTDSPGGAREVVGGGAYGGLVAVGDSEAFADAWLDVIENPVDACRRARQGVEASVRYSPEATIKQYLEILAPS